MYFEQAACAQRVCPAERTGFPTSPRPDSALHRTGALFSGTLWFGNAAYTYLSVSFIQMLKALMPAAVFTCGLFWGVEKKDYKTMCIMAIVTTGVMIASYGELLFVVAGVVYQLLAICTESNRIVLVQILLQSKARPRLCCILWPGGRERGGTTQQPAL